MVAQDERSAIQTDQMVGIFATISVCHFYGNGSDNVVADALSRLQVDATLPVNDTNTWTPLPDYTTKWVEATQLDNVQCFELADRPVRSSSHPLDTSMLVLLLTHRNAAQTKTSGPRDEGWLHRRVKVLGSWFNNNKEHRHDVYEMEVVAFEEGKHLHQDRWVVQLLNPDGSLDDNFRLSFKAMCQYLVPLDANSQLPDSGVMQTSELNKPTSASPALPVELPTIDAFVVEQQHDDRISFWFSMLQSLEPPILASQLAWWKADKDNVFVNENGLLCRFANLTTASKVRPVVQVVVPQPFIQQVLFYFHGSDTW